MNAPSTSRAETHQPGEETVIQDALTRRTFVQMLGAGLLVSVPVGGASAQRRRGRRPAVRIAARVHIGTEGQITVLSGKVEMGQGSRGELSQAAAEELRVPVDRIVMVLGDTSLVPDDGITAGSRTTPSTVPAVRRGAAAARQVLVNIAAQQWRLDARSLTIQDGSVWHQATGRKLSYADLAKQSAVAKQFDREIGDDIELTPVTQWRVMGRSLPRPNRSAFVTGAHKFPSDIALDGMWYGKVLRPPSYGARLSSIDVTAVSDTGNVRVVRDGDFVGCVASATDQAHAALKALAATAKWETDPQPSDREIYAYLRDHARGGVPKNPFAEAAPADRSVAATYQVAYVQHAPLETRNAVARWQDGKLTVWTGSQNPFGFHRELVSALQLRSDQVRVVIPDFGGGYGGKHTAEAAIEAARLARAAGRPVSLKWTREEEFTWAYFRPAAVIDAAATLDPSGRIATWHFVNINSGGSAVNTPYRVARSNCRYVRSEAPLRQGSYRVLAATANNFARECFMDELAIHAKQDPLEFRLAHLEEPRLRAVLMEAASKFDWPQAVVAARRQPNRGVGLACGTEKGSVVATCVEVEIDRSFKKIRPLRVREVFECGAVVNPDNLRAQVQGCIIMGLGPALREALRFADGKIRNASFGRYEVPRFRDIPQLDIHLLNRPDLPSAGGGETPIIGIAPAIANAVRFATGKAVRAMPIRLS